MKRKLIVSILAALCFSVASYGWAWSHKLIGYMAQRNCTETTKAQLDRYLDVPLADISLWMDIYRDYDWGGMDWSEAPEYIQGTTYWHMLSVDKNGKVMMESGRKDPNGNGMPFLLGCIEQLKNYKELSDSAVVINLKYLTHLMGDAHCPAHYYYENMPTDSKGETGLDSRWGFENGKYNGKTDSYHGLFDRGGERVHPEFEMKLKPYTEHIDTMSVATRRAIVAGTVKDWIDDSATRCWEIYEWGWKPGKEYNDSFYVEHGDFIIYQIQTCAYRLAHTLNLIFDPEYKGL
jgi:hypothetical protein